MNTLLKNTLLILGFFIAIFSCDAQRISEPQIENVKFLYKNEKIEISYDIINFSKTDKFNISIIPYKASGERLNAISITGDLKEVEGGTSKLIYWQQRNDGYILDEEIYFEITATNKAQIPLSSHLIKSIIYPGWGDYRLRNKKFHFVYGMAAYAFIASSIYMNQKSIESYSNYKNSFDVKESDLLYNEAVRQQNLSYLFAGAATLVWTIDLAGVFSKTQKLKKEISPETSKYYYAKSLEKIKSKSQIQYISTKQPYDLAMERGNKYEKEERYYEAKNAFEEALSFQPNDELAKVKIETTIKNISVIKNRDIEYNDKVARGQVYIDNKEYEKAILIFREAQVLKPNEKFPSEKINEINSIRSILDKTARYEENIRNGNIQDSNGNFEAAKVFYEKALSIKPEDPVAQKLIDRIDDKLAVIAVNEQNALYNEKMSDGDKECTLGHYQNAKTLFQQALNIKPNESAPLTKIESCNHFIYKKLIIQADVAYDKKQFDKGRDLYNEAHLIFPTESYPINRIKSIDAILANASQTNDLPTLYKSCKKSVFMIIAADYESSSQGSGFFITSDGIAITNYHVVEGILKSAIRIYTDDGNKYKVDEILETNKENDYAIFKVKPINGNYFHFLKIATTEPLEGEKIFTIGNPQGLEQTLSDGIVQAYRSERKYLQTSTTINHGSSGGPLFNSSGEVIGITTLGSSEENLFFAVNIKKLPLLKYLK